MPFDAQLASVISAAFRASVTTRLDEQQRSNFEGLLQIVFGVKNLRNVQLWTRPGVQTRNFLSRRLGEMEMDLRTFLADRFVQNAVPSFPVKTKTFLLPADSPTAYKVHTWLLDNWIREYCTRVFVTGPFLVIEYAADSDNPNEVADLDSPEFDDIVE